MSAKNRKWIVLLLVSVAVGILLIVSLSSAQLNHDASETEEEEEIEYIKSEIARLKAQPELRIGGTAIHRTQKEVILWVYELTPENQQLHGTMIGEWKIIVAESPKPSVFETLTHPPAIWVLTGLLSVVLVLVTYRRRVKPHL